ncbi:hypothetical protein [Magnetospirillum sulfuroxidans]|uniref:Transposase n=1 Tax=Magnetospirillum sulfuroxidans TaxID=611300 RepID=A0ABS5IH75_9PROT|nr:hypothetical protein [Magnetospirillum sulfuroxidans]MBR9973784.1 hypothetical protein [Magnetospirillum sulfuroxidans]
MSIQPKAVNAGDRVHYCAWYLGLNDNTRYLGYAIRKQGGSDLEAAFRSISRRLNMHGFEIGTHEALEANLYRLTVLARLTRNCSEALGEARMELRGISSRHA